MVESIGPPAPRLNAAQLAWLREIGMDKRLLSRFQRVGAAPVVVLDRAQTGDRRDPEAPVAVRAPQTRQTPSATKMPVSTKTLLQDVNTDRVLPHDLAGLQTAIAACQACSLCTGRSQTVFGSGPIESAAWMVIGEAPGDKDDRMGLPFQGTAGVLLHAMLQAAGVRPESSVFFTNLVKCRPLGNRTPEPDEVAACLPYLQRQIALLRPQRILALGRLAAQSLLDDASDFEQLRGRVHVLRSETGVEIPLVATYHPAFLLSRPQYKASAWRDLNLARTA